MTMNTTIEKFGYPHTLIAENDHWVLLLRPKQVTLGSLILASKSESESMAGLGAEEYISLGAIVRELETALRRAFEFEKINYLALMMKDKHVHFHVFPRYMSAISFAGVEFKDDAWPGAPNTSNVVELSPDAKEQLLKTLKTAISNHG
jgi:diadenosine tetraphosphate (Ap4A) HIT family hydrolase